MVSRPSAATLAKRLAEARIPFIEVGLDLRWDKYGFFEVFDPDSGKALTFGVGVDFWLEGYRAGLAKAKTL